MKKSCCGDVKAAYRIVAPADWVRFLTTALESLMNEKVGMSIEYKRLDHIVGSVITDSKEYRSLCTNGYYPSLGVKLNGKLIRQIDSTNIFLKGYDANCIITKSDKHDIVCLVVITSKDVQRPGKIWRRLRYIQWWSKTPIRSG